MRRRSLFEALAVGVGLWLAVESVTWAIDRFSPVASSLRASQWSYQDGWIQSRVVGKKGRDCQFVKGSEAGLALQDGLWVEVPFAFLGDVSPGSSRPIGENDFGVWAWQVPEDTKSLLVTVRHECDGNIVSTSLGPFDVGVED